VRGRLTLQGPDGPFTLAAPVVRSGSGDDVRWSWHGDLSAHLEQHATLVTDDGPTVDVIVGNQLLRPPPMRPSTDPG
jgi:hypothetical protein